MISSQKDSFLKAYKEGKNFIPIVETWPADLETPLSTWLKLSSTDSRKTPWESFEDNFNQVDKGVSKSAGQVSTIGIKFLPSL